MRKMLLVLVVLLLLAPPVHGAWCDTFVRDECGFQAVPVLDITCEGSCTARACKACNDCFTKWSTCMEANPWPTQTGPWYDWQVGCTGGFNLCSGTALNSYNSCNSSCDPFASGGACPNGTDDC